MIFAALAFGAATLVEVNVVVRMSNNHDSCFLLQKQRDLHQNPPLPTHIGLLAYLHTCMHTQPENIKIPAHSLPDLNKSRVPMHHGERGILEIQLSSPGREQH